MGKLSATAVKAATRPGKLGDGDGLYLVVKSSGTKSWMVRVQKNGNRRDFGLGSASKVSLTVARERAREVRTWVELGLDPLFERRKAEGIPTFREAAAKVLAQHRATWRNEKHEKQWIRTLEAYAFPHLGNVQVNDITGPMIRNVLAEIWLAKPETARRVRQRIGTVLDWAYASGYRDSEAPMRAITKGLPQQNCYVNVLRDADASWRFMRKRAVAMPTPAPATPMVARPAPMSFAASISMGNSLV